MKIVVTGGGTGGHISPAISIADRMLKEHPGSTTEYIGSLNSMESELVPKTVHSFWGVKLDGFYSKKKYKNIKTIWLAFTGVLKIRRHLKKIKPDIVIGTGGYVSGPVVLAALSLGIKTVLHEGNVHVGIANRWLMHRVDKILFSYKESLPQAPNNGCYTGMPIRNSFKSLSREEARASLGLKMSDKYIVVVAGSGGSIFFNRELVKAYQYIDPTYKIIHVTGKNYRNEKMPEYSNVTYVDYLDKMAEHMVSADLMIARAGTSGLNEMLACTTPGIIIPSPNVMEDHQTDNAKSYEAMGTGIMVKESSFDPVIMSKQVEEMLNEEKQQLMRVAAKNSAKIDAIDDIYHAISEVLNEQGKEKTN